MAEPSVAYSEPVIEGAEGRESLIDIRSSSSRAKYLTGSGSTTAASGNAAESRKLSRQIASRISDRQREALHDEHTRLATKKVLDGLSYEESCQLDLIRWSLDRIHDAEYGPELDRLEKLAEFARSTGKRVNDFLREAQRLTARGR